MLKSGRPKVIALSQSHLGVIFGFQEVMGIILPVAFACSWLTSNFAGRTGIYYEFMALNSWHNCCVPGQADSCECFQCFHTPSNTSMLPDTNVVASVLSHSLYSGQSWNPRHVLGRETLLLPTSLLSPSWKQGCWKHSQVVSAWLLLCIHFSVLPNPEN